VADKTRSEFSRRTFPAPQFAEFAHFAPAAVSEEAGAGFVPAVEMAKTNPMAIAAVHADVDRAGLEAVDITALVIFHGSVMEWCS